ncbi:MAG: alpha/beta hydrolase [Mycobacteriales bacterium]
MSLHHPDLRLVGRLLPRGIPLTPRSLPWLRRGAAAHSRRSDDTMSVVQVGDRLARVHRPAASGPRPALLWIHGGGYVLGSPAQDDQLCRAMSESLDLVVLAPSYRLAPEHPFPAPLEDCYQALTWLARQPDVDPSRIAIGGASAGGGLAAALALLARDRGEVPVAFQLLAYPMLDDRTVARTDIDERGFRLWNNRCNAFGWGSYLGNAEVTGLAAAARAEDLAGLPPTWLGVGTQDLFFEENQAYAERLRAAGVPCALDIVQGAFHGFDSVCPRAPVTHAFRAAQIEGLRSALS